MFMRKIKDAIDLENNEKVYFKGHAKATYMSDGSAVEDAVNNATIIAETAKNAVSTLEGLSNATEAMEILAAQVVQIEENKQNIATNKKDVDEKLSELGSEVNTKTLGSILNFNLKEYCSKGLFIREDGVSVGSHEGYGYIYKVYCKGLRYIEFNNYLRRIIFYNSDSEVISNVEDIKDVEIPSNTFYISMNIPLSDDEVRIIGLLYDEYSNVDFGYIKDSEEVELETYDTDKYVTPEGEDEVKEGRIIYKFNTEPLGIYNIKMFSLASAATDVSFFNKDDKFISSSGRGINSTNTKIIVAPINSAYAKISTRQSMPVSVKRLVRTDNLCTYLDNISIVNQYNDTFVNAGIELLKDSGFIRVADGTKGHNNNYVCSKFLPIIPGSTIITNYIPGNTSGYAFYSEPNEESFVSGTQQLNVIEVPNNALYFRVSSAIGNEFVIGYFSATLGAIANDDSVKNYNISYKDLKEGYIQVPSSATTADINIVSGFRFTIIRCVEGQIFDLNTIASGGTAKAYRFFNKAGEAIESGASSFKGRLTAPKNSRYLGVNVKLESMPNAEEEFYLKSVFPSQNEIEKINKEIDEILGSSVEYGIDDLKPGNLNTYPVGNTANIGELESYNYGLFPCTEGREVVITTLGGYNTARGLGFIDADNNIIFSSVGGQLTEASFIAPKGTAFVGVNLNVTESNNFKLRILSLNDRVNKNNKEIENIKNDMAKKPTESIPLWHGKDMFFIKDSPLDFYAKEVLLKNYPTYNGVYVNYAPIVGTGENYDFNLPIINHISPEGKIYFNDGARVDIYADNGMLYKDKWNVVKDIEVHTTDISLKQKSIKVMCIGSSTTQIGMATYVKKYLETFGVAMIGCGSKNDYLGTKSEGYYGWSNEQLCGKIQNATTYPQTGLTATNPFMKLATSEDKINYPDYCFTYIEGSTGARQSYSEATDKEQDFYIFDFAWYLQTRQVENPDVVFFLFGTNGSIDNYGVYMPWIVDRIIQACPNAYIGINLGQAYRLESAAEEKLTEMEGKLTHLYNYVYNKNYEKMKVVSLHAYQSPDFSHNFEFVEGENPCTSEANPIDGFLHMDNNGYLQDAKCIGAYIAYCLPNLPSILSRKV